MCLELSLKIGLTLEFRKVMFIRSMEMEISNERLRAESQAEALPTHRGSEGV